MPFASPAFSNLPPGSQSLLAKESKESSDKSTVGASGRGAASSIHILEVGPSGLTPGNWKPFAVPVPPASAMISADGMRLYSAGSDGALYATQVSASPSDPSEPCLEQVWFPVVPPVQNR